jgi:predicted regulator of Ras-like GTPase activity (Roadblock/LC7/MglB family)
MTNRISAVAIKAINTKLKKFVADGHVVNGAILATDEGITLTHAVTGDADEATRFAAIVHPLAVLSVVFAQESELGDTPSAMLTTTVGRVLLLSVPVRPHLSFAVVAAPNALLGHVLFQAKARVDEIVRLLVIAGLRLK